MSKTISQQGKEQRRTAQQPGAPEPHGQHDPRDVRTSLLSLQHRVGNRATGQVLQPKLVIGAAGDRHEQEADDVADQVMQENGNAEDARSVRLTTGSLFGRLQRKCDACEEEEEEVQRKEEGGSSPGTTMAPINVREALDSPGQPLDVSTRAFFEPRFGYDFGNVRLHTGTQAADSARAINAKAYTAGNHIVMGQGQYDPTQVRGQQLLAHELTHVIQQANGGSDIRKIARAPLSVQRDGGKVTDPLELMEGVTEASVYMIVIDNSSGRTRFYTRGGKTINGKLVQLTSTFKPGEYLLKRSESEDKKRTWDIEYPDGKTYRGGLEFEVQLDGVNFNSISYTPKVQLRVASGILPTLIDIDQRIKAIKDEVSKKLVNNKEEQAILQLLSDIPPEQAEEFVKKMREEMVGELPLLERLDRDIDGENNIARGIGRGSHPRLARCHGVL
jgi:hypothetical protein